MPKQKTIKTTVEAVKELEKANSNKFIVIHDQVLQPWVCDEIMSGFDKMPVVEVKEVNENDFMPTDPSKVNENHRFERNGRIHGTVLPNTPFFEDIFDLIGFGLPKGYEFATVNYVQIIKYTEDSHFPWHKDVTDPRDTGTALVFLNDDFMGGNLTVAGHKFCNKQGTIVAFNKSQEVWHSVEPLLQGVRYVLAIWFGKPSDEDEDK